MKGRFDPPPHFYSFVTDALNSIKVFHRLIYYILAATVSVYPFSQHRKKLIFLHMWSVITGCHVQRNRVVDWEVDTNV